MFEDVISCVKAERPGLNDRKELNAVQVSILRRKGTRDRYAMPSPVTTDAKRILTALA